MGQRRQDGYINVGELCEAAQPEWRAGADPLGWAWKEQNRELSPRGTWSREWYEEQMDRLGAVKWCIVDMWP